MPLRRRDFLASAAGAGALLAARASFAAAGVKRTLLKGGMVLTIDPAVKDLAQGDVLIENGRIAAIGADLSAQAAGAEVVDCAGKIVMPGFVDTHRHTYQALVRGILPDCTLDQFMSTIFNKVAPQFNPARMEFGNYLGALDALDSGITTMVDWSPSETPAHSDGAITGLRKAGIRSMYAHGMPAGAQWWNNSDLNHPEDAKRIRREHFSKDNDLMTMALALRQPGNASDKVAVHDWHMARDLDIRVSVHTGMRSVHQDGGQIKKLNELKLLGPTTTLIHVTASQPDEYQIIADTNTTVSLAPYVEMIMGHGKPPIAALRAVGVHPTWSADSVTTSPGDMFTQMRVAFAIGRLEELPADHKVPFAPKLTHLDVIASATIHGAAACGLEKVTGSLTPGKDADVIILRVDGPGVFPDNDPAAAIIGSCDRASVESVMVRGEFRKRNFEMVGLDMAALRVKAAAERAAILGA